MHNPTPSPADRRADPRLATQLPARATSARGAYKDLQAVDLSLGGACLAGAEASELRVGERIRVALRVPAGGPALEAWGRVRWTGGRRAGIQFARAARCAVAAFMAAAVGLATPAALADSAVPTFDPQADQDLEGYDGSERPDEQRVLSAFEQAYDEIDRCVAKVRRSEDDVVKGDANLQILLNPRAPRPLGVNAAVDGPHRKNRKLVECLRRASAKAPFPTYDGPPVVVEMSFELDPGYDVVEG